MDCGEERAIFVLTGQTHLNGPVREARGPVPYRSRVALPQVVGAGKVGEAAHAMAHDQGAVQHIPGSALSHQTVAEHAAELEPNSESIHRLPHHRYVSADMAFGYDE